jgi:hypothetical protein
VSASAYAQLGLAHTLPVTQKDLGVDALPVHPEQVSIVFLIVGVVGGSRRRWCRVAQHAAPSELDTSGHELGNARDGRDDLHEWKKLARSAPWLLDGLDVLRFRKRSTHAIGRPEEPDAANEMDQGVLARQFESGRTNTGVDEDAAILMEAVESLLHAAECRHGVSRVPGKITEVKKSRDAPHHVVGNMTSNSGQEDL